MHFIDLFGKYFIYQLKEVLDQRWWKFVNTDAVAPVRGSRWHKSDLTKAATRPLQEGFEGGDIPFDPVILFELWQSCSREPEESLSK